MGILIMFEKFKNKMKEELKSEVIQQMKQSKPKKIRSFKGAKINRFTNWLMNSFAPINQDLKNDLRELILRSRDLAKNNEIFRSHLHNMQKSIVGRQGFRLQSLIKSLDGKLDDAVNVQLEKAWFDFGKRVNGYIEKSGTQGDIDLDILILRTLIIDGEVFIRVDRDAKNEYGISFELLDGLTIDTTKNQLATPTQNAIVMGVQIDKYNRPIQYWIREHNGDNYNTGKLYAVPADEIIHIYKQEFVGQTRGFGDIVASIDSLKQLDDFAIAELVAAKISACQGIFYQRTGDTAGDFLDQSTDDTEDQGNFIQQIAPGIASIVPQGYTVKSMTPTHPNTNFAGFVKAIVRRISSACGISYNRLAGDYEAVNYSSLREASLSENKTYANLQRFLIDNWKNIQYELFLRSYIINFPQTKLTPTRFKDYLDYHFIGRKEALFDEAKEIVGIQRKLKMGLTNPIIELEQRGLDPKEVIEGWVIWKRMCEEHNLDFELAKVVPLDVISQYNEEANTPPEDEQQ